MLSPFGLAGDVGSTPGAVAADRLRVERLAFTLALGRGEGSGDADAVVAGAARLEAFAFAEVVEQHLPPAAPGLAVEDHALEHRPIALALVPIRQQQLLERVGVEAGAGQRQAAVASLRDDAPMAQQPQRDLQLGLRPVERLLQRLERPRGAVGGLPCNAP